MSEDNKLERSPKYQINNGNLCEKCGGIIEKDRGTDWIDVLGVAVVTIFILVLVATGFLGRYTISIFVIVAVWGIYILHKMLLRSKSNITHCDKCQNKVERAKFEE